MPDRFDNADVVLSLRRAAGLPPDYVPADEYTPCDEEPVYRRRWRQTGQPADPQPDAQPM